MGLLTFLGSGDSSDVSATTRAQASVPETFIVPSAGTRVYRIVLTIYNNSQTTEDPDNDEVALNLTNASGISRNNRLFKDAAFTTVLDTIPSGTLSGSPQMERIAVGVYEAFYKSSSTDTDENIITTFQYVENTYLVRWDVSSNADSSGSDLVTIESKIDTVDTVVDGIKAVTDLLPNAGALTSLAQDSTVAKDATVAKEATLSTVGTNVLTVDTVVDSIKAVTDNLPNSGSLSSLAQDSTVAKEATLGDIQGSGFVEGTDSLEAISNAIGALNNVTTGAVADAVWDEATAGHSTIGTYGKLMTDDSAKLTTIEGKIDTIDTVVDGIQTDLDNGTDGLGALKAAIDAATIKYFQASITSAANAGTVVLGTVGTDKIAIESVCLRSEGATTADLTSAAIKAGPSGNEDRIVLLPVTLNDGTSFAVYANLNAAGEQVGEYFNGATVLNVGERFIVDLQGTGTTAVALTLIVSYRSVATTGGIS